MGITQVTVAVRNPARPKKFWEGLFLVDTGAVDCLVPRKQLRALGLKPRGKRIYELADGSEVTLAVTVAELEFMGERVGATVVLVPTTPSRSWVSRPSSPRGSRWIRARNDSSDCRRCD
jgi:clan AA aspartic protease